MGEAEMTRMVLYVVWKNLEEEHASELVDKLLNSELCTNGFQTLRIPSLVFEKRAE